MDKGTPTLALIQAINEGAGYDAVRLGDSLLRGANAALHGDASLAGQVVDEIGLGGGDQLERDLVGMEDMAMGSAGRAGGLAAQGTPDTQTSKLPQKPSPTPKGRGRRGAVTEITRWTQGPSDSA